MLIRNKLFFLTLVSSLPLFTLGCGGQAYQTATTSSTPTSSTTNSSGSSSTSTSPSTTPSLTTTSASTSTTTASNLPSPIQSSFSLVSSATALPSSPYLKCNQYSGQTVSIGTYSISNITTDNLLQATVKANAPMSEFCGTTASTGTQILGIGNTQTVVYSCVQLTLTPQFTTAKGSTISGNPQTVTVSYGSPTFGHCANVSNSATVDFSSFAQQEGVAGAGSYYSIVVSSPQIDNCHNQYPYYSLIYSGCGMEMAYNNFIVSGSLAIQTNTP